MRQPRRRLLQYLSVALIGSPLLCGQAAAETEESWQKLLASHGWKPDGPAKKIELQVPQQLSGPAFSNYQRCSQKIGLSLEPLQGKSATLYVIPLNRRTGRSNSAVRAYVATKDGRCYGAWLGSDAPVAPGIGSLDEPNFGAKW